MRATDHTTTALLAGLVIAFVAAPAQAQLWSADHETSEMAQWYVAGGGGEFTSGNGSSSTSTDHAHSGRYSAKLTIDTSGGDHGARLHRWKEPESHEALYYRAWYYFPQRYEVTAGWWSIMQWKSRTDSRNDPFWIVYVGNRPDGTMYLYLRDWINKRSYEQTLKDVPVGHWFQLEAYYRRSSSNAGQVTIWQDGAKILEVNDVPTSYVDGRIRWGITNYSSGVVPAPTVIYADDAAIGTTRFGSGLGAPGRPILVP